MVCRQSWKLREADISHRPDIACLHRLRIAQAFFTVFAALVLAFPRQAVSQDQIHWAYSAFLGTGWYQVEKEQTVFVLRAPFYWDLRDTDPTRGNAAGVGLTLDLPVTFGLYQLDMFDDLLDLDNFGTVSFTPGLEAEWAVSDRWWLRGYGHLGWGVDTRRDEQAWMWDAGIKSRYVLGQEKRAIGLFAEVFTAGYRPENGSANNLGGIGAGVDYRQSVSWRSNSGEPLDLVWDLNYRWYGDELTFNTTRQTSTSISEEWRLGAALALRERRIRIWLFEFDQIGLAYRFSSDGQFRGLTFNINGAFRG